MQLLRSLGLGVALAGLAATGAAVAILLLSTIGGVPEHDPVGRLRPVLPGGAPVSTVVPPQDATTSPQDGTTSPSDGHDRDHDGDDD